MTLPKRENKWSQWTPILVIIGGIIGVYTTLQSNIAVNNNDIKTIKDERIIDRADIKEMRNELKNDIKVLGDENKQEHRELLQEIRRMSANRNFKHNVSGNLTQEIK